jgi:hypothetical protein
MLVQHADPQAKADAQKASRKSIQAKRLKDVAGKDLKPIIEQLGTLDLYNEMLDNPNAFDQKKLQVLGARLVEGPGQRLLDSVIQAMGANKGTLEGTVQDKMNYLTGQAKAGLPENVRNAMRETSFKYLKELSPQYEETKSKFKAYAPSIAPDLDDLDDLINTEFATGDRLSSGLSAREKAFLEAAKKRTTLAAHGAPSAPQYAEPKSVGDKLKGFFSGALKAAGSAMEETPEAPVTPPAPQGGIQTLLKKPQAPAIPQADAIAAEIARRRAGAAKPKGLGQ